MPPPLWFSLNSVKIAVRSAVKFSVPFRKLILHLHTKFQGKFHLRSGVIEVKLRSCSSGNELKTCNLQTFTKATVFKQFQISLCGFVEKRQFYKTAISEFQNFGVPKNIFQELIFVENFDFLPYF